jgi:RNAse (barnase) inhibitor barstar
MSERPERETHFGPGPVHVAPLTREAAAAICALAGSLGFQWRRIDLAGCSEKGEFLESVSRALEFPAWFGHNWDALFDCLTDLSWHPAPGYVLVFEHAAAFREIQPEAFDTALAIFSDVAAAWQKRGVSFRVFVSIPAERSRALPGNSAGD